jgi:ferritin-like metal-binding protein YciE
MAAEPTTRDAKLIQYLNEAYGKEKELETALKAHISMTTRDAYKKRLRDHLKETQQQAKGLERRIKQLGGKAEALDIPGPDVAAEAAGKAVAAAKKGVTLAKGPLHMIRGTGEAEKLLKNAKTELWNEFEEIGNYLAIEELATAVGDRDTAKLAKEFRRQEERMATFLQKLIPQLTKAVAKEEIPAAERRANGARTTRRRSTTSRASSSRTTSRSSGTSKSSGSAPRASSSRSSGSTSRASTSRAKSTRSSSSGSSRSSSGTRSTARRSTSSSSRSGSSSRARKS